jgi:hypothetical protein|tara:strand:- start:4941 stop:5708 length:768 start_codon:yes stop_codon:yes gene_type:complete
MLFAHEKTLLRKAWDAGISRVMVDWETREKEERQHGYHLEQNYLTRTDLIRARQSFPGKIVCRINPIHDKSDVEITDAIDNGADIIMLPMFKTVHEVDKFIALVGKRVETILLFESVEAIEIACKLRNREFEEAYIGLNDLSISLELRFAYQIMETNILDRMRDLFPDRIFGFGGITILGRGYPLPTELILTEMARLDCRSVIIRRAFKKDVEGKDWVLEIAAIRNEYNKLKKRKQKEVVHDREQLLNKIREIVQ